MELLEPFRTRPWRVLDLGGSFTFWTNLPDKWAENWSITVANPSKAEVPEGKFAFIDRKAQDFDPRALREEFDLIFSNSMMEHLGTWRDKVEVAQVILGSGLPYFVQTPNYWFPLEPHWLIPGFQWMPRPLQHRLLARKSRLFRTLPTRSYDEVEAAIDEVDMLTAAQLRRLFPGASIHRERVLGLTKSFVAHDFRDLKAGAA